MFNLTFIYAKLSLIHLLFISHLYENNIGLLNKNPVITCNDLIVASNPNPSNPFGGCEGQVKLKASAVKGKGCAYGEVLYWDVLIDKDGDDIMDIEYSSHLPRTDKNISDDSNSNGLPDAYISPTIDGKELIIPPFMAAMTAGIHKVIWTVRDGCSNTTTCTTTFRIKDKKSPTPLCVSLSSAMLQDGKVELFAIDFNKGSFDNCTPQNELLYTFNSERPVHTKISEVHYFKGMGIDATVEEYNIGLAQKWLPHYRSSSNIFTPVGILDVNMSVWDKAYNTDFCKVTLNHGCPEYGSISGNITSKGLEAIEKVKVVVQANVAEFPQSGVFDGVYYFDTKETADYMIEPSKSDDYHYGINTLDLAALQRHLTGIKKLTMPEQLIAADVNGDAKIDNDDYYELKKLVLGMTDKFSQNRSWFFIPKTYVFPNPDNPFSAPTFIIVNVASQLINLDFIGIKIGDIDGSTDARI